MAGIYIHIPFCKKKCHYCDFYKTTEIGLSQQYISCLKKEIELQKSYLGKEDIETVYFGGGTPSALELTQLEHILESLHNTFSIINDAEITIEVNPDDADIVFYKGIAGMGFNRISLGIQSWDDRILKFLNRRHDARQAELSVKNALTAGLNNISVDMIYGIPEMSNRQWKENLSRTYKLDIKHLSAYHLSIEKGTFFNKLKKKGMLKEIDEQESEKQFNILIELSEKYGFIQYEISNLCREGFYSKHNTNYWKQEAYLGLGPSAHSYNAYSRQWNVADLAKYISSLEKEEVPASVEILDEKQKYNEYIMTSLRTMWGVDLDFVERNFSKESRDYLSNLSARFVDYGMIEKTDKKNLVLTNQGKMISDNIISELMMV